MKDVIKITDKSDVFNVLVGSDAHFWPGQKPSTGWRAFLRIMKMQFAPIVVLNGDVLDFSRISKYPPLGWQKLPAVAKEIKNAQEKLQEITKYYEGKPFKCRFIWAIGNHDLRFDKTLAAKAAAFNGLPGTKLSDYFPRWEFCERVEINGVVVKHSLKGGANPLKSNLVAAGTSIVTGHHHCQNVLAYSDYSGTRYAVDAGMLGAVNGPQFAYNEGNPANWRSGFALLPFRKGNICPPQLATVLDEKKGACWFNGYTYKV